MRDRLGIMVSMKRFSTEKRAQIIGALVEGNSIRPTCRMTGTAKNTVTKLLVDVGQAAADYQDRVLRDLPCKTVEVDEIWSFCYAKNKSVPEEFKRNSRLRRCLDVHRHLRRHEGGPGVAGRRAHRRRCRALSPGPG